MSAFVDTNVLIYAAVNEDAGASRKRRVARDLLLRDDLAFSLQVFNEFVSQATRSTRSKPLTMAQAMAVIALLRRGEIIPLDLRVFDAAVGIERKARLNWWDCLIVAAAVVGGCTTLYSEDMQHGQVIEGVRIENPFR